MWNKLLCNTSNHELTISFPVMKAGAALEVIIQALEKDAVAVRIGKGVPSHLILFKLQLGRSSLTF